jgi:hypothetical protein
MSSRPGSARNTSENGRPGAGIVVGAAAAFGTQRVPYPMGFFAKGIDGRIDDPKTGWKGRGLWVTSGNRTPFHIEGIDAPSPGAPGATPQTRSSPLAIHFQLRPDPLAQ